MHLFHLEGEQAQSIACNRNTSLSTACQNAVACHTEKGFINNFRMYQREVDVDMLNAVKSLLADVSSVSPSSVLL